MKLATKTQTTTILLFLIVIGCYFFLSTGTFSSHLEEEYRNKAETSLNQAQEDIEHFFKESVDHLDELGHILPLDSTDFSPSTGLLNVILEHVETFFQIAIINANGIEIVKVEKFPTQNPSKEISNLFSSPIYQTPMLENAPYIGSLLHDPNYSLPLFSLAVPYRNKLNGLTTHVLSAQVSFQDIQSILERYLPVDGKIMLVNADNLETIILADSTKEDFSILETSLLKEKQCYNESAPNYVQLEANGLKATFFQKSFRINRLKICLIYYQPNPTIYFLTVVSG